MQWSKLKARVEAFFAPSVAGRVELRTTHYRHVHDGDGRGWITIDGSEVYNFCTLTYWVELNALDLRHAAEATNFRDPERHRITTTLSQRPSGPSSSAASYLKAGSSRRSPST